VEERIIQLNRQRAEGTAAGAAAAEGEPPTDRFKGKMKVQAATGSINTDRQELKVAELELLFQVFPFPPRLSAECGCRCLG
jgi:hypothetical protein